MTTTLQTVSRAIAMLRAFEGGQSKPLTLKELSDSLSLSKMNTLRLAKTLVQEGLLAYDFQTRRYSLSWGCFALVREMAQGQGLREVALPSLEAARDATSETACLMVREGWHRVVAASVHSKLPIRYVLDVGERRPVYFGAAGQCLMSGLTAKEWQDLLAHLAREKASGRPCPTPELLQQRQDALRSNGWYSGTGEWAPDASGAAAPVYGARGQVLAAVTIAAPLTRASAGHMEDCGRAAMAAARAITLELVGRGGT
jgi:DNA-binding IclR family transcriptional regulator